MSVRTCLLQARDVLVPGDTLEPVWEHRYGGRERCEGTGRVTWVNRWKRVRRG